MDGDGIPNVFESTHGMNPNDASDAASDFDLDGLTALQEYQHGTNPTGEWTREILDTSALPAWFSNFYPQLLNDQGTVVIAGGGTDPETNTYRNATWIKVKGAAMQEFVIPSARYAYIQDMNSNNDMTIRQTKY